MAYLNSTDRQETVLSRTTNWNMFFGTAISSIIAPMNYLSVLRQFTPAKRTQLLESIYA